MLSDKPSIQYLVEICARKGLRHVVISPGSRNAPINVSFHGHGGFICRTITDERVAAFIGLGIGQQTQKPAILICTSGTAALNYGPAIAEAYYQKIPLLILTADRPVEFIDQGIGQTIRQKDIYQNYIKSSYELIEDDSGEETIQKNIDIICQALDQTMSMDHGPVHINVPLREPLYDVIPKMDFSHLELVVADSNCNDDTVSEELIRIWNASKKKLIIVGQSGREENLNQVLNKLAGRSDTILLSEATSHVFVDEFIQHIDRVIDSIPVDKKSDFYPDLIISLGGAVVSKKIKVLLRNAQSKNHWHIGRTEFFPDTYGALSHKICADPVSFLSIFIELNNDQVTEYKKPWLALNRGVRHGHEHFIKSCPWSDLYVFSQIIPNINGNSVLHLANSTPIRYAQLFDYRQDIEYRSNRGVGGIDGSTSTAVGSAIADERSHVLITGDLSFLYDSNAFWINDFPANLKVIVINNGGGNIFRIIPGPSTTDILEEVFEAHHQADIAGIAQAYRINYLKVDTKEELMDLFPSFLDDDSTQILEIVTPRLENDKILKDYFNYLKKSIHQYA